MDGGISNNEITRRSDLSRWLLPFYEAPLSLCAHSRFKLTLAWKKRELTCQSLLNYATKIRNY